MKRKNLQILAVVISPILVALLLATACAKQAAAPTQTPTPTPAPTQATPAAFPASERTIDLKFADAYPPQGRMDVGLFEPWAKEIEELTNGRVKITIYSGGALGSEAQLYNLVLTGSADIVSMSTGTVPGVFPRADALTLPLSWKSNEAVTMAFWELMKKYMIDTEFKNVKVFWVHTSGLQQVYTRTKPIRVIEDLKGMKLGSHLPMLTKTIQALGGVPVFMLPPEVYTSLERGLIDGWLMDWEGFIVFRAVEVTKYHTGNVNMSTSAHVRMMNLDVWNSLPPDIQKIFDEKGEEWSRQAGASWDETGPGFVQQLEEYNKRAGNPPIYYLPEDEKARWTEAVQPVIDAWAEEVEAKGLPGKAILADLRALQEKYSK